MHKQRHIVTVRIKKLDYRKNTNKTNDRNEKNKQKPHDCNKKTTRKHMITTRNK